MSRRALLWLIGCGVSALGLVLAFARVRLDGGLVLEPRVRWSDLRAALAGADPGWLAMFTLVNILPLFWRALQLMAAARTRDGRAPRLGSCWRAVWVGQLAQTVLPARLGEAARVLAIVKDGGVAFGAATGAVVLGRVFDLWALLLVTCVPPLALGLEAATVGPVRAAATIGSIAAIALVALLYLVYRWRRDAASALGRLSMRLGRLVEEFGDGLSALGSWRRFAALALSSLLVPATVAAAFACGLRAFSIVTPTGTSLVLVAAVFLAIAVPSAPSSVGVFHAVAGWALTSLGAPAAPVAAFTLTTHAIGVISFSIIGAHALSRVGMHLVNDDAAPMSHTTSSPSPPR